MENDQEENLEIHLAKYMKFTPVSASTAQTSVFHFPVSACWPPGLGEMEKPTEDVHSLSPGL